MEHLSFRPDEAEAPAALGEALRRAYRASEPDASLIDGEVLGARARLRLPPAWVALAAAAGLALAVTPVAYFAWPRPTPAVALRGDADGSGRVDILDAFLVARSIAGNAGVSTASNRAWDVTGDGTVDQRDVDAIAGEAVSLGGAL